ncbi:MAG: hypothetical protein VW338_14890 [Rhodospirillaceae bacterium]
MNAKTAILKHVSAGAVLYLDDAFDAPLLLAPVIDLNDERIAFHDLVADRPHVLQFDELQTPHNLAVRLLHRGRQVGYLTPAREHSSEIAQSFAQLWTNQAAAERERLTQFVLESITEITQ